MLFMMDVLTVLRVQSQRLQQTSAVVIGMEKSKDELLGALEKLKTEDGPAVKEFLATYKCVKEVDRLVRCKTKDLDDGVVILNQKFRLKVPENRGNHYPSLSSFRNDLLDSVRDQIQKYFPDGALSQFDVFLPEKLPSDPTDVMTYVGNIADFAIGQSMDGRILADEFSRLLFSLLDDHNHEYCIYKAQKDPVQFWGHFLNTPTVDWQPNIRSAIEKTMALPVSTADVERGFSILKHIRGERRSRLTPQHLDDIMFLRVNGPKLGDFDPYRYTKAWYADGGMRSDDERKKRVVQKNELPKSTMF